ncbi:MAG: DUF2752 domain-containing protein [Melioribacteraceae bacterium]|nr:DUF2752 domain-containing protein [Melioribacteraceae bacterium]
MKRIKKYLSYIELEALMWLVALLFLFFINPYETQHFTLCPYKNIGIDFCPGCGIGKSISFLFHFDLVNSIKNHPLGIFGLFVITYRIFYLLKRKYIKQNKNEVVYG